MRTTQLLVYVVVSLTALLSLAGTNADEGRPANATETLAKLLPNDQRANQESDDQPTAQNRFDDVVVHRGRLAFESACTQCHDAERSLDKAKSLTGWLATVRRMAAKADANVPPSAVEPIATYLASRSPPTDAKDGADGSGADSRVSINGTVSAVWRGTDDMVENKGFFPDVWIGADWRPSGPISGSVTACTSCHGQNIGLGVELVEASASLDLIQLFTRRTREERDESDLNATLKAGRFIVPFGAFSAMSHPGAMRTATNPLMFNMGRRVGSISPHQPVLPAPYSDEGININLSKTLWDNLRATADVYTVNGLQDGGPAIFFSSRSYRDNNQRLAVGGRCTIGDRFFRIGGSIMSGELQPDDRPLQNYVIAGGDVTVRFEDFARAYFEYAIRTEDTFFGEESTTEGTVVEGEIRVWKEPRIGLLVRYDTLDHRGGFGEDSIYRITSGLNISLPGGSLLSINHERWVFVDEDDVTNIIGLRWTGSF